MDSLFAAGLNVERLIMGLELYAGHKIDPENTLLIFDEVQEVPRVLSSLKYCYEDAPQYHINMEGGTEPDEQRELSFRSCKGLYLKLYDREGYRTISDDIIGLALESGSVDALIERVRCAVPELLELNRQQPAVGIRFKIERYERISA